MGESAGKMMRLFVAPLRHPNPILSPYRHTPAPPPRSVCRVNCVQFFDPLRAAIRIATGIAANTPAKAAQPFCTPLVNRAFTCGFYAAYRIVTALALRPPFPLMRYGIMPQGIVSTA